MHWKSGQVSKASLHQPLLCKFINLKTPHKRFLSTQENRKIYDFQL